MRVLRPTEKRKTFNDTLVDEDKNKNIFKNVDAI